MNRAALARALDYPYRRPEGSFVVSPDSMSTSEAVEADVERTLADRGLTAVVVVGSNGAPEQLFAKFGGTTRWARPLLVVRARWRDHDAVFAARVARYGAVPATSVEVTGTVLETAVVFLDPVQLERMDETEGTPVIYRREQVGEVEVLCGVTWHPLLTVYAYQAACGPLLLDGTPVALGDLPATNRQLPAMTERELLEMLAARHAMQLDDFVEALIRDDRFRSGVEKALSNL